MPGVADDVVVVHFGYGRQRAGHIGTNIGHNVPVWDSHDKFGDTALLVENMEMGRDLARAMGAGRTILMRGHGATVLAPSIRNAVFTSVYLEVNAKLQMQAMAMGDIKFLTPGEVDAIISRTGSFSGSGPKR